MRLRLLNIQFPVYLLLLLILLSACSVFQKPKSACVPFKTEKQETQFLNSMHLELYSDQAFEDSLIALEIKRLEARRIETEREDSIRNLALKKHYDTIKSKQGFDIVEVPDIRNKVYENVQERASFQGGIDHFYTFFKEQLGLCKSFGKLTQGQIYTIDFDIKPDGKIANITWKEKSGDLFMQEVNRCLFKSSGLWRPARFNGVSISTKVKLQIRFKS